MAGQTKKQTLKEYGRGVIGGLLFSLPLVYTMEVWWSGFIAPPAYLLTCVGVTYLLLLGYNRYAGMKPDSSFKEICWESVEEIGLAFVVSFLFLLLISRIDLGMSLDEIAGKVIVESMIVAIGISVGTAQLGGNGEDGSEEDPEGEGAPGSADGERNDSSGGETDRAAENSSSEKSHGEGSSGLKGGIIKKGDSDAEAQEDHAKDKDGANFKRLVLSLCGSVLFASSVAPTEEILMIAVEAEVVELLLMVFVSLLLGGIILYFSEFRGTSKDRPHAFLMLLDLSVMYMIALLVSFSFLWFFGRTQDYGLYIIVAQMVVLGIPAALGASAGRFLIAE